MSDSPRDCSPVPPCGPFCPGAAAMLARLLAPHSADRPLLTPAGLAYVRNLLVAAEGPEAIPGPFDPAVEAPPGAAAADVPVVRPATPPRPAG